MAKAKKKTKAEELQEAVAEAVGAGRELHLESVDFSDPNRPKTCLEVDFPIIPVNSVSSLEAASGAATKSIYQMSKWWARRQSSVFRAMLIAAATKAPEDQGEAAKTVWDAYYGNHQKNEVFRKLKVADIFMGGGTTIVEGARLGMQMYGNDLNPVAWLVVKNELAQVDPNEVQKAFDSIEAEVKPQIMPFYACDCPRGHKGKWTHKPTGKVMGGDFDALSLTPEQRPEYEYEGTEVIYTFWAKHGPCQASECNHRTPIMNSPVVASRTANKALSVKTWKNRKCKSCGSKFDIEQRDVRLAPLASFVISPNEEPFAAMDDMGRYKCPHCTTEYADETARHTGKSATLGKASTKKVTLSVLVHPNWLKGDSSHSQNGSTLGGSVDSDVSSTKAWLSSRQNKLALIEVRGALPEQITLSDSDNVFFTDSRGGTVTGRSEFACQNETCGKKQDVLESVHSTGTTGPIAPYAVQVYCPECDSNKEPGNGRYYDVPQAALYTSALKEWDDSKQESLSNYWPTSELSKGWKTHGWAIPDHGYTHYWKMFNSRQLLVHAKLLQEIDKSTQSISARDVVLGAFTHFLRCNCSFTIWHLKNSQISAFLSNNSYQAKNTVVETAPFAPVGDGSWRSGIRGVLSGIDWQQSPWEIVPNSRLEAKLSASYKSQLSGKTTKVPIGDPAVEAHLSCASTTELPSEDKTFDLVVTDPPFGEIMQYAELSDFFYVWLRLILSRDYPTLFTPEYTPKALEVVSNPFRNDDPNGFYQRLLTTCWREALRVLKPSGLLAFTFHHEKDGPWISVLESLFEAGAYLEGAYPVRSDASKGDEKVAFGAEKVEYDIIHVCRKRLTEPEPISWARLRRQIMKDVRQLQEIIEQHQKEGLGEADLQVIRRGKALEYFSRHYGKVYIEKGREDEFTVKDALVGINQLLDDESDTTSEAPPVLAEPYTRQFLRLFADNSTLERDQMQKYLRGTGVSPSEFLERGWCSEEKKVFTVANPQEWANQWKGKHRKGMSRDFDQTYFLIGACYDDSGIKLSDTLNSGSFVPHPAISDLLDWFAKHGSDTNMKSAAKRAKQIYSSWLAKNTQQVTSQRTLFDLEDDE